MVQRAKTDTDMAGTLDVTAAQVFADFDALLDTEVLVDPGPPWLPMPELMRHIQDTQHLAPTTARSRIMRLHGAGKIEIRKAKIGRFIMNVCRIVEG